MAKKIVVFSLGVLIMLFLVFAITTLVSTEASAQEETWDRRDQDCPDPKRQKTRCIANGNEQCTAKYCNEPI